MKKIRDFLKRISPITNTLRIAFWCLILFAGTGILLLLFHPLQSAEGLRMPVTSHPELPKYDFKENYEIVLTTRDQEILSREVLIDISASKIKADYVLVVPSDGEIAREITIEIDAARLLSFIELTFGRLEKPGMEDTLIFDDPDSYQITWTISSKDKTLRFVATVQESFTDSIAYLQFVPSRVAPVPGRDKLMIDFDGFRAAYIYPLSPQLALSDKRLVIENQKESLRSTTFLFRYLDPADTANSSKRSSMSRQLILQDLDDWLGVIPIFPTILFAILEALPLLFFLRIYRSRAQTEETNSLSILAIAVGAFLTFHFILYILSGITNWFSDSEMITSASQAVVDKLEMFYRPLSTLTFELSSHYFGIIILGVWIPAILFNWWSDRITMQNTKQSLTLLLLALSVPFLTAYLIVRLVDQYFLISGNEIWTPLEALLSTNDKYVALVVVLIFMAAVLWQFHRTNRNKSHLSWLQWLDQLAQSIIGWGLWVPLIVAAFSFLSIYIIENDFFDPLSADSLALRIASIMPLWMWIVFLTSAFGMLLLIAVRNITRPYVVKELNGKIALYSVGLLMLFGYLRENPLGTGVYNLPDRFEWTALLIVFGTLLVASLIFLVFGAIERITDGAVSAKANSKWLWLGAVMLALPMNVFIPSWRLQSVSFSNLYELAYALDNTLVFLWLGGVLLFLHQQGNKDTKISKLTYEIGILAATAMLFSATNRWFFIPLTFIVGWLGLRYLIYIDQDWNKLNQIYQYVSENRNVLLEKIINMNAAQASFDEFRKRVTDRFSKSSKTTFQKYDSSIVQKRVSLDKQIAKTYAFDIHPKELVFAFGPYPTSWRNALHGAVWAVIFAIPWLVLYMRSFLTTAEVPDTYSLLIYLVSILYISFFWIGMGFTFGYFFPYIRGATGVSKGFKLFILVFVASLPIAILYRESSSDWRALLFWGLQIFIECMLLGLVAFDYWTLRNNGRGWQMLFDVHGLAKLGISVSTILAAIGAAIVALLTTQATNLMGISLKFIFPDIPADFLPK